MSAVTFAGARRSWRVEPVVVRVVGVAAMCGSVLGSWWVAVGAADGHYLLLLPTGTAPEWVDGPLRSFGLSLSAAGLSAALVSLVGAYLVALACAGQMGMRLVLVSVVLSTVAFTLGPTIVSTDVFGYIAYAREAALHGLNPYVSAPSAVPHDAVLPYVYWKAQTSPYGPLFTFLSVPLGLVSVGAALWTFKAVAGIAAVALVCLVADLARRRGLNPARAAVFVGLNPVLLVWAVSGAHNDLLAVALVVLGFAFLARSREGLGAGLAVAAGAVKLTVGLALPFVGLWARRRGGPASRSAVRGGALALLVLGVPTLAFVGPHVLDQLHRIATDRQFDIAFSGPDRLAVALGGGIERFVRAASTGGFIAVAVWMLVRVRAGADPIAAAGWAFLALICSIASLAPWYLVWLLPLAALGRSRRLAPVALVATLYLVAVHVPAFGGQPWLSPAGRGARAVGARTTAPSRAPRARDGPRAPSSLRTQGVR